MNRISEDKCSLVMLLSIHKMRQWRQCPRREQEWWKCSRECHSRCRVWLIQLLETYRGHCRSQRQSRVLQIARRWSSEGKSNILCMNSLKNWQLRNLLKNLCYWPHRMWNDGCNGGLLAFYDSTIDVFSTLFFAMIHCRCFFVVFFTLSNKFAFLLLFGSLLSF